MSSQWKRKERTAALLVEEEMEIVEEDGRTCCNEFFWGEDALVPELRHIGDRSDSLHRLLEHRVDGMLHGVKHRHCSLSFGD